MLGFKGMLGLKGCLPRLAGCGACRGAAVMLLQQVWHFTAPENHTRLVET